MRNEQNFIREINHNNAALEADFCCDCGSEIFRIAHSGHLRKGLFGSISISERQNQLLIKCSCTNCGKQFHLYNSTKDGSTPQETLVSECAPLTVKGENSFHIKLRYNFMEEHYKTDQFEMFFLDVKIPGAKKYITVCEL